MLTRLYADNYRALVNTNLALAPRTLLMGRNGTGKSTFGDVLWRIQTLLFGQSKTDAIFGPETLTRWQQAPQQRFEIDVKGPDGAYQYGLTIEHREVSAPDEPRTRIFNESLTLNGNPLFRFENGMVRLFSDDHTKGAEYPFDWGRSALGTITPRPDNKKLTWFGSWLNGLTVIRLDPLQMGALVERDDFILLVAGSNFASWYHGISAANKRQDLDLHRTLAKVLPGFEALNFEFGGPNRWYLRADFASEGRQLKVYFNELSDGQRATITLYSVVHFLLAQKRTVLIDEPDNFISLDEIQPWLLAATDTVDDGSGQLVIISHHPEVYDQWAVDHGVVAEREGCGPVRTREYIPPSGSALTSAEAIARGLLIERSRSGKSTVEKATTE
jgi:predicted ATPase